MSSARYPNVLFIVSDQMKWSALRMYSEFGIETPSLERLAREGVRYENAITPHPLCVPARVSMMTARYSHSTGCRRNETLMPSGELHAFRIWKELDFTTGLIGKNHCYIQQSDLALLDVRCEISHAGLSRADYLGEVPGNQGMEWVVPHELLTEAHQTRNNMPWQGPVVSYAVTDHPLEGYSSSAITAQVEAFLDGYAAGDTFGATTADGRRPPFALQVSYPDPHHPLEVPRKYAEMSPPDAVRLPPQREGEFDGPEVPERNRIAYELCGLMADDQDEARQAVAVYLAMVRFIDDGIARILDKLEELGLRDDTIIVFASDHGDFAGEHNMLGKAGVFYDSLVRVPLIVSWPAGGVPANVVDGSLVNTVDILPTLLQLGNIADFTTSPPVGEGDEIAPAGPRMLCDTDSGLVSSESLRRLQGKPLPTATNAEPRAAAFSEYGAGGPAFTMEMLGQLPEQRGFQAVLGSLWSREAEGRRKMVRTRRWKYVTDPSPGPTSGASPARSDDELYDLEKDPWELRNVAQDPGKGPIISEMRALLSDWMIETEEYDPVPLPRSVGRGPKPDIDTSG